MLLEISENWQVSFVHPVSGACVSMPMSVPGNFAKDLVRAGFLKDSGVMHPGSSEAVRVYENVPEWRCETIFSVSEISSRSRQFLVFHGVDTIAEIKLNGELLGKCENMFLRYEFEVSDKLVLGDNHLEVCIIDPVRHAESMELDALAYWTSLDSFPSYIRRSRCLMSWDNAPRLLTGGLWRKVELIEKESYSFEDCYIYTRNLSEDYSLAGMGVHFFANFPEQDRGRLTGEVVFAVKGKVVKKVTMPLNRHYYTLHNIEIDNPELWWPRGYGDANLYEVSFSIYSGETLLCRKIERIGIRFVLFNYSKILGTDGSGDFAFFCNHQRIYCRGTNWKPVRAYFCDITPELNRRAVDLAIECNCNMIRVWGGGIYEDQDFFDYCDENGLMVWQDFMMACEFPLQSEENQQIMKDEAKFIVKEYRNHASLFLWCGDNEVDKGVFRPVRFPDAVVPSDNLITRKIIPEIIKRFDPFRFYLPSSPFICDELAVNRKQDYQLFAPSLHLYVDNKLYHDKLRTYPARFLAETGPIGFSAFSESEEIIKLELERLHRLWEQAHTGPNPPGMGHQADCYFAMCLGKMRDMFKYEFGRDFTPDEFYDFAPAVNFICAEVFKDAIEYYRMCKPIRTGVLWWSLMDMFPMLFNYSVVDAFWKKKLPFYWIKQSQQTVCMMMDVNSDGTFLVKTVNDSLQNISAFSYRIYNCDVETCEKVLLSEGEISIRANDSVELNSEILNQYKGLFLLEWGSADKLYYNHFICVERPRSLEYCKKVCNFLKNYYV